MKEFKHLTFEERVIIEDRLNHKVSVRSIAKELKKSPSTIVREVKNHSTHVLSSKNDCLHRKDCLFHGVCGYATCKEKTCAKCKRDKCKQFCSDYVQSYCEKNADSPYACNGCSSKYICRFEHDIYKAVEAEKSYQETLTSARSGFDLTDEQLDKVNTLASPLLKQGLSPYHVIQTYKDEISISEATLRRLVNKCELDARNIDLRDAVKRKVRTNSNRDIINQKRMAKIGHSYSDYLEYITSHDITVTEMDCVEGKQNESEVLLTLNIVTLSMQLYFILPAQTSENVVSMLNYIEQALGTELFSEIFPLILTDNGSEFADIEGIEKSCLAPDVKRTKVFFCEPNRSDEKGSCENHHKLLRYIFPKGSSFKDYTQADLHLVTEHINSYKRKALFGKSAFELAHSVLPEDFFLLLGYEDIPPDKIILTPKLLTRKSE